MGEPSETKRLRTSTEIDHSKYKQVFRDYYKKLSDALPTDEMLPGLFANRVITMEQKEEIQAKETLPLRTRQLLDGPIWSWIKGGYPDGFIKLLLLMLQHKPPTCDMLAKEILNHLKISSDVIQSLVSCKSWYQLVWVTLKFFVLVNLVSSPDTSHA